MANFKNITFSGYPQYVAYVSASDVFGDDSASVSKSILSAIPEYAETVSAASNGALDASSLETIYETQHGLLFETDMPIAELLIAPGEGALTFAFWPTQPFSQGGIHISANNISAPAAINPNYFMLPIDNEVQAGIANYVRKVLATEPVSSLVTAEVTPGLDAVPESGTPEEWGEYLKSTFGGNNHPVSTAAMLPKDLGGVVASDLKVYGTSNLRVVDASVLPQQLAGHLSSTLYAIAEKAADLIKKDVEA